MTIILVAIIVLFGCLVFGLDRSRTKWIGKFEGQVTMTSMLMTEVAKKNNETGVLRRTNELREAEIQKFRSGEQYREMDYSLVQHAKDLDTSHKLLAQYKGERDDYEKLIGLKDEELTALESEVSELRKTSIEFNTLKNAYETIVKGITSNGVGDLILLSPGMIETLGCPVLKQTAAVHE